MEVLKNIFLKKYYNKYIHFFPLWITMKELKTYLTDFFSFQSSNLFNFVTKNYFWWAFQGLFIVISNQTRHVRSHPKIWSNDS